VAPPVWTSHPGGELMGTTTTARQTSAAPNGANGRQAAPTAATTTPRKLRRRPAMALFSVGLVLIGAVLGVGVWMASTSSVEVVAARAAIERGAVITDSDLTVARVAVDPSVPVVPAAQLGTLVGKRAASDVAAGTLLSPAQVTEALPPGTGESVVGVALTTGQLPAEPLRPGDRVRLVQTPLAQGEVPATQVTIDAEVQSVTPAPDGQTTVVDLLVPSTRAAEVAARAATGRVAVVLDSRER